MTKLTGPLTAEEIVGLRPGAVVEIRVSGRVTRDRMLERTKVGFDMGGYFSFTLDELADPKRFREVRQLIPTPKPNDVIPQDRVDELPPLSIILSSSGESFVRVQCPDPARLDVHWRQIDGADPGTRYKARDTAGSASAVYRVISVGPPEPPSFPDRDALEEEPS